MHRLSSPGARQCDSCKVVTDHHNLTPCERRHTGRQVNLCHDCEVRLRQLGMVA